MQRLRLHGSVLVSVRGFYPCMKQLTFMKFQQESRAVMGKLHDATVNCNT